MNCKNKYAFILLMVMVAITALQFSARASGVLAYFNQGTFFLEQGQLQKAVWAFSQAIEANPSFVEAYNNRALAYYQQGKNQEAKADFLKALKLSPQNEIANSNLGILFFEQGRYGLALKYLKAAALNTKYIKPYHVTIYRNLAYVYEKTGRLKEAEKSLQNALAIKSKLEEQANTSIKPQAVRQCGKKGDYVLVLKVWQHQ